MPKGIPKAGFRMTRKRMASGWQPHLHRNLTIVHFSKPPQQALKKIEPVVDVDMISNRIAERFEIMSSIVRSAVEGYSKAVIISGPPGVGKSYEIKKVLENHAPEQYTISSGYVRATGLFRLLHQHQHEGQVIVFDDSDSVFADDVSLNLLKAACDTTERRTISWLSEVKFVDEEGEVLPRSFEFNGTIIFITNLDFDGLINRQHKLTEHLKALMSRSHYVDLTINSSTACLIRVRQVIEGGMLRKFNMNENDDEEILKFMSDNLNELREISLRMVVKIALLKKTSTNWTSIAKITCCHKKK